MSLRFQQPAPAAGLLVKDCASGSRLLLSPRPGSWLARPSSILGLAFLVAASLLDTSTSANAFWRQQRTDANVVTAIDVSDSIGRYEEWLQQTGLVRALLHPDFLRAATAGPNRQIGFAVFTWSSDGKFDQLIPWTLIRSAEDAARVSAAIKSVTLIDRTHYGGGDVEQDRGDDEAVAPDRRTDLSAAIDYASLLLTTAPHETQRSVMNICANGVDNVDDGTAFSRERALAQGLTINGLVIGQNPKVTRYFRSKVIGGPGAFVMESSDPKHVGEAMVTKFVRDLRVSLSAIEPQTHVAER
ncbi:DUF1194 domain-containing protein [Mesorhizobium sp. WSM2239]|uniref:DUF1194 domain-containing protein n=1 Tax=Mesorhizobium sp. WSM2239 TaxID=3228852 RepID=A0AAU8DD74_9HYPH